MLRKSKSRAIRLHTTVSSSYSTENYSEACRVKHIPTKHWLGKIGLPDPSSSWPIDARTDRRAKTGMEFTIRMRSRQLCHRSSLPGLHLLPSVPVRGCKAGPSRPFRVAPAYHPAVSCAFTLRLCLHLHAKAAKPCRRVTASRELPLATSTRGSCLHSIRGCLHSHAPPIERYMFRLSHLIIVTGQLRRPRRRANQLCT